MKTALIITAPLLCLLSAACSEEADAPVRTDEQVEDVEMPPQPDISHPIMDENLTEEEADAALKDLEERQKALESGSGGVAEEAPAEEAATGNSEE